MKVSSPFIHSFIRILIFPSFLFMSILLGFDVRNSNVLLPSVTKSLLVKRNNEKKKQKKNITTICYINHFLRMFVSYDN